MSPFKSIFAKHLKGYVELRRGLGLVFENQERFLFAFDRFVCDLHYKGLLTQQLALAFATAKSGISPHSSYRRYQAVRHFSEYLSTFEPRTPMLDVHAVARNWQQPPPYIFTEMELDQLLSHAAKYSPTCPALNQAIHAMLGLAASTGLRLGEVIALDVRDVDLKENLLTVRQSKFHKDRLVAIHSTTAEVLRAYAAQRVGIAGPFFVSNAGRRFADYHLDRIVRRLVSNLKLQSPKGKKPSFRSLRHTFAVHRLARWYRAGVDVQAMLPVLATYMGHVHYTSTSYYLTATAELLGLAVERLTAALGEAPNVDQK